MAHEECRRLLGSLSDYVDGDLGEELCVEIEQHMQGCDNCRIVVDSLRKTIYLYHATATPPQVPEEVKDRLFRRLDLDEFLRKKELRAGDLCPNCGVARLDYDGLLNLACPGCGYAMSGGYT